jgi:hypothetical protein
VKVEGVPKLIRQFRELSGNARRAGQARIVVGYSAPYAIYVHENLNAYHPIGQAKFLEGPARRLAPLLARIVRDQMKRGASLDDAEYAAAQHLLKESQAVTPVDTGALRKSGFVRKEGA